jgi:hypothetical protein
MMKTRGFAAGVALLLVACGGGKVPNGAPDAPVTPDAHVDVTACEARIQVLAEGLDHGGVGACTLVVRLDHETYAVKGYYRTCAPYASVDEQHARISARQATGFAVTGPSLTMVDQQAYVFVDGPPDPRGLSIVSSTLGTTVFAASIGDTVSGDVTYPLTWGALPSPDLQCPYDRSVYAIGFDLLNGGAPLSALDRDRAVAAVTPTGLLQALRGVTDVLGVIVLHYPRMTSPFDPSSAEWIVVVGAGWLE